MTPYLNLQQYNSGCAYLCNALHVSFAQQYVILLHNKVNVIKIRVNYILNYNVKLWKILPEISHISTQWNYTYLQKHPVLYLYHCISIWLLYRWFTGDLIFCYMYVSTRFTPNANLVHFWTQIQQVFSLDKLNTMKTLEIKFLMV